MSTYSEVFLCLEGRTKTIGKGRGENRMTRSNGSKVTRKNRHRTKKLCTKLTQRRNRKWKREKEKRGHESDYKEPKETRDRETERELEKSDRERKS